MHCPKGNGLENGTRRQEVNQPLKDNTKLRMDYGKTKLGLNLLRRVEAVPCEVLLTLREL